MLDVTRGGKRVKKRINRGGSVLAVSTSCALGAAIAESGRPMALFTCDSSIEWESKCLPRLLRGLNDSELNSQQDVCERTHKRKGESIGACLTRSCSV